MCFNACKLFLMNNSDYCARCAGRCLACRIMQMSEEEIFAKRAALAQLRQSLNARSLQQMQQALGL